MTSEVSDNMVRSRFELPVAGGETAFIDYYRRADGALVLTHAEVPEALRGGGIGAKLTGGTLDLIRARGERMVPVCPYIVQFVRRHPAYGDLIVRC
jgi:predicted GNAT family acetyltransferase